MILGINWFPKTMNNQPVQLKLVTCCSNLPPKSSMFGGEGGTSSTRKASVTVVGAWGQTEFRKDQA